MTDKPKFPSHTAWALAEKLIGFLSPDCDRIMVCGSLRRQKLQVGDIEIVYIPKTIHEPLPESLFGETKPVNLVDRLIDQLLARGTLEKRLNTIGSEAWGTKNKLARLVKTGVPVDLFATTEQAWFNYIVCRTGSADTNTLIATLAQARGSKWNPYGPGFTPLGEGEPYAVRSEEDVFNFVGLDYLKPWQR